MENETHAEAGAPAGAQHSPPKSSTGGSGEHSAQQNALAEKNTLLGILAYIGPLILVSFLLAKDDPFVKFHIKQGLLLVIGEVATWMIMLTIWVLFPLLQLVNLAIFILAIVGIVRAAQGQEKPLPLIGHFAKNFDF